MDIRLRNKRSALILTVVMLYLWTVALYAAADIFQHTKYFNRDEYFRSSAFVNEIELFSKLFLSYYIDDKPYMEKTPQEKIGSQRYNELKSKSEQSWKEKESSLNHSYADKIDAAVRAADTNALARWTEERDKSMTQARKQNEESFEASLQKLAAVKDEEYRELQRSLDIRRSSIQYYVRNAKTGEVYTNVSPVPANEEALQQTDAYRNALAQIELPAASAKFRALQFVSQSFGRSQLEGVLVIPSDAKGISRFQADYTYFLSIRERLWKEVVLGAVCLAAGIGLYAVLRRRDGGFDLYPEARAWVKRKVPVDIRAAICFFAVFLPLLNGLSDSLFYMPVRADQAVQLTLSAAALGLVLVQLGGAFRLLQARHREELRTEWEQSFCSTLIRMGRESWQHKSLLFKLLCLLALTVVLGLLLGLMLEDSGPPNEFVVVTLLYAVIYMLVVVPFLLQFIVALNRIMKGTEQLAAGNFETRIPAKGSGQLSVLAHHLNHMRDSFQQALEDRMKSERMKSELITNVSHDLKTPLTSIINYVHLLKREGTSSEEAHQYIEVLDRKTDRLKVLIDDLFEASKMASGAVELNYEKVDVAALMHQALAECSEKVEEAKLTFRVNASASHLYARLDGMKTWRVFENLISNAVKYSLPNTRVYITMTEQPEHIEIRMQNVSAYEIDFEVEELFERFKRGDQSRHTEGSGLGLAIAKNIVELQGGRLTIEIDGDQFKVKIQFPK